MGLPWTVNSETKTRLERGGRAQVQSSYQTSRPFWVLEQTAGTYRVTTRLCPSEAPKQDRRHCNQNKMQHGFRWHTRLQGGRGWGDQHGTANRQGHVELNPQLNPPIRGQQAPGSHVRGSWVPPNAGKFINMDLTFPFLNGLCSDCPPHEDGD